MNREIILHPFVVCVSGKASAALYDLHKRRLLPVSSSIAKRITDKDAADYCHSDADLASDELNAREYRGLFEDLLAHDYARVRNPHLLLKKFNTDYDRNYPHSLQSVSIEPPGQPQSYPFETTLRETLEIHGCSRISIHLWPGLPQLWREQITQFVDETGVKPTICIDAMNLDAETAEFLKELGTHVDIHHDGRFSTTFASLICSTNCRHNLVDKREKGASTADLDCSKDQYVLLNRGNPYSGNLHIDRNGAVYLHWRTQNVSLGQLVSSTGISDIVRSDNTRSAWSITKDDTPYCSDCELRYCCTNPPRIETRDRKLFPIRPKNCSHQEESLFAVARRNEAKSGTKDSFTRLFSVSGFDFLARPEDEHELLAYRSILIENIKRMRDVMNLSQVSDYNVQYFFDKSTRDNHFSANSRLTEDNSSQTIRSNQPCHLHEISHALLAVHPVVPCFFVGEATASMFGLALRNDEGGNLGLKTASDLIGPVWPWLDPRASGGASSFEGITDIFDVSRAYRTAASRKLMPLRDCFFIGSPRYAPPYMYEYGGAFFRFLLETYGCERFKDFYLSGQTVDDLERVYGQSIENLETEHSRQLFEESVE